jgi:NAD dependent epimerase/dehydratase family enzyme
LRCAGLAGYDRNIVKYFAGKKNLKMGNAPVNLIHRDDVIEIILKLLQKNIWNKTYNLCAPLHPLRKDIYPRLAIKYNYETPEYDTLDTFEGKIISGDFLAEQLQYSFKFPDPYHFLY